jgi:hypothetical protein
VHTTQYTRTSGDALALGGVPTDVVLIASLRTLSAGTAMPLAPNEPPLRAPGVKRRLCAVGGDVGDAITA